MVILVSGCTQVWEDSDGQSLLQIQVMLALQRLLVALGPKSPICYDILFPILQYSTDVNQPDELNMLEDGMQVVFLCFKPYHGLAIWVSLLVLTVLSVNFCLVLKLWPYVIVSFEKL